MDNPPSIRSIRNNLCQWADEIQTISTAEALKPWMEKVYQALCERSLFPYRNRTIQGMHLSKRAQLVIGLRELFTEKMSGLMGDAGACRALHQMLPRLTTIEPNFHWLKDKEIDDLGDAEREINTFKKILNQELTQESSVLLKETDDWDTVTQLLGENLRIKSFQYGEQTLSVHTMRTLIESEARPPLHELFTPICATLEIDGVPQAEQQFTLLQGTFLASQISLGQTLQESEEESILCSHEDFIHLLTKSQQFIDSQSDRESAFSLILHHCSSLRDAGEAILSSGGSRRVVQELFEYSFKDLWEKYEKDKEYDTLLEKILRPSARSNAEAHHSLSVLKDLYRLIDEWSKGIHYGKFFPCPVAVSALLRILMEISKKEHANPDNEEIAYYSKAVAHRLLHEIGYSRREHYKDDAIKGLNKADTRFVRFAADADVVPEGTTWEEIRPQFRQDIGSSIAQGRSLRGTTATEEERIALHISLVEALAEQIKDAPESIPEPLRSDASKMFEKIQVGKTTVIAAIHYLIEAKKKSLSDEASALLEEHRAAIYHFTEHRDSIVITQDNVAAVKLLAQELGYERLVFICDCVLKHPEVRQQLCTLATHYTELKANHEHTNDEKLKEWFRQINLMNNTRDCNGAKRAQDSLFYTIFWSRTVGHFMKDSALIEAALITLNGLIETGDAEFLESQKTHNPTEADWYQNRIEAKEEAKNLARSILSGVCEYSSVEAIVTLNNANTLKELAKEIPHKELEHVCDAVLWTPDLETALEPLVEHYSTLASEGRMDKTALSSWVTRTNTALRNEECSEPSKALLSIKRLVDKPQVLEKLTAHPTLMGASVVLLHHLVEAVDSDADEPLMTSTADPHKAAKDLMDQAIPSCSIDSKVLLSDYLQEKLGVAAALPYIEKLGLTHADYLRAKHRG